jgi:hypothetical protein
MEVHFTPEQEAQLAQIATKAGAPELPVWNLGTIGSMRRRDLYNDVR